MAVKADSTEEALALIEAAISAAFKKAAFDMEAHAVRVVPVDTGRLKSSIHLEFEQGNAVRLVAGVDYAGYVEFGTMKMRAQPYVRPAVYAFIMRYFPGRLRQELRGPSSPARKRSGAEKALGKIDRTIRKIRRVV